MYAFIVKNDENTWDIYETLTKIPKQDREEKLANAVASGLPITGMDLTPYKETAASGAVWNGKNFTGGSSKIYDKNANWDLITQYGYLCDNVLLLMWYAQKGTEGDNKLQAIFNSETTIIKVPEDQTAKIGDLWDGTQVISV